MIDESGQSSGFDLSTGAEPVATVAEMGVGGMRVLMPHPPGSTQHLPIGTKLYAAPPAPSVAVKAWAQHDAERENGEFKAWFDEQGYPNYPQQYPLTTENAMHAAWQEAAERSALSAQVQDAPALDARMKAAGMYTIAEMMGVTPLTKWKSNPAINTIEAFSEWLDRRVSEYLSMKAGYDLGDKSEDDDLCEWVLAHAGVFSTIRDQFQVVTASLGMKVQEVAVAEIVSAHGDPEAFGERDLVALVDIQKFPYGTKLYAAAPAAKLEGEP